MRFARLGQAEEWDDLFLALEFVDRRCKHWKEEGVLKPSQAQRLEERWAARRKQWNEARIVSGPPADSGLPPGHVGESATMRSLRFWHYLEKEVSRLTEDNLITLAQSHAITAEAAERRAVLERRLTPEELPDAEAAEPGPSSDPAKSWWAEVKPAAPAVSAAPGPRAQAGPRRNVLEILLDPRNIQWLLVFGGGLFVVGLIIMLYLANFFTTTTIAIGMGIVNAAVLAGGWWVLRSTRHQMAGRALTLLACLVMPLNLWYYHLNALVTLDGHLWVAAVVISALYAASALVLRENLFVYVFVAGVTLTGLLILADLPPSPQKFWEIAAPASLLIVLGLLAIHAERAFPVLDGPFSRQRFGLAFFWCGHALLAGGLLLVLGAQVAGDWLYQPWFRSVYEKHQATPSPIVGDLRWLALLLVVAGTYAYVYSDLVVRQVGVYVHVAAFTLLWALVLVVELFHLALGLDAIIGVLATTALAVNLTQSRVLKDSPYTRAFPVLGVLLPLLAVLLGLGVYFQGIHDTYKSIEPPAWSYVAAMALTAIACRFGAHLYRETHPRLMTLYFFATGAATLAGAAALLAVLGLNHWMQHAPILMALPIVYLVAAHLQRDKASGMALLWVAHAATVVMLLSSLASAFEGFSTLVEKQPLNLSLALFFAEASLFYVLAAMLHRQEVGVHLCAATGCATVWQLLTYVGVSAEYYTLAFALTGMVLLVAYRFAIVERFAVPRIADAAFQSANTLLSLSFVAAAFLTLSRLQAYQTSVIPREDFQPAVWLCVVLTLASLLSVALVQAAAWRRWYVVTTIGLALLTFLGLTVVSTLSKWQKLEIFSVASGLLLLVAGHIGWYREQERESDLTTLALLLGSFLAGLPLAIATLVDRSRGEFLVLNELGFLAAGVLLLTLGFLCQLKVTTLVGAGLTALYFITLPIRLKWGQLDAIAIFLIVGGGTLFGLGLVLSVFRDRLLTLPDRVKRREGMFRVLNWR